MGDDRDLGAEHLVAASVVGVEMGVEDILGRVRTEAGQRAANAIGLRCRFAIDEKNAVLASADADIAAAALEHIDTVA